jgi:hypothetical protein
VSRRLVLFNMALLALCGLAVWRLRDVWQQHAAAEATFLSAAVAAVAPPVVLVAPPPEPVAPAEYLPIAQQLLMSRDRNPTVIIDVEPEKPMPALPKYYGSMNFGGDPRVVLALAAGGAQRSYKLGETVGAFKLLEVQATGLVFEWDGKKVPARYADMRDTTSQAQNQAPTQSGSASATVATISSASSSSSDTAQKSVGSVINPGRELGPGPETGTDVRPCLANDNSPPGTVVDGYRKVIGNHLMGKSCYWQKVQ